MPAQHYHQQFNVGMPPQNQLPQFSQPIQQFPPRVGQQLPLPSQMIPMPVARPNMQTSSESMMPKPDSQAPNGYTQGLGGPGMPISSSFMVKFRLVFIQDNLILNHTSVDSTFAFL
jgi:pre-mRNA-processing factor 40